MRRRRLGDRGEFVLEHAEGSVLDVGCGKLHPWALTLFARRPDVALDVVEERVELSWFRGRVREVCPFVLGDAHHLPFRDGAFRTAVLADVLEHVRDPRRALEEALRVAERVVVTVPYGEHRSEHPQYTVFTEDSLAALLRGLKVAVLERIDARFWSGFGVVIER